MSVCVLGTGGTWWPPMCCFSTNENSLSPQAGPGGLVVCSPHLWGKSVADEVGRGLGWQTPSTRQPGRLCPQPGTWEAGAGAALIAFLLCWPPALRGLLFNEENSLNH